VHLDLTQGNLGKITARVKGEAHLGVSTLLVRLPDSVLMLPAYSIERCFIAPPSHPLLKAQRPRLEDITRCPLITYDRMFNSGNVVPSVFERHGLRLRIAMKATDANVIKVYVAVGFAIAGFRKWHLPRRATKTSV
jgi:LysR family cys regulon transcriptional activator